MTAVTEDALVTLDDIEAAARGLHGVASIESGPRFSVAFVAHSVRQ